MKMCIRDRRMDASLFEQVLVNIIKNAAESIEGDAGENGQQGEIIAVSYTHLDVYKRQH